MQKHYTYPTIDEADYDIELRKQARNLRDKVADVTGERAGIDSPAESLMDEAVQQVKHVVRDHEWFHLDRLSGSDYGAIVSDFSHFNGDISEYRDVDTLTEGEPDEVLKNLAWAQFEADVLEVFRLEEFET